VAWCHAGPHDHPDFTPDVHGARRGPDRGPARGPDHRARDDRRNDRPRRILCGFVSKAIIGRRARTSMSNIHEEEALGKAYDSRLMRRLLDYMRPYRWRVIIALALVAIVTPLELAPPLLFKKTIDDYLVPGFDGKLP